MEQFHYLLNAVERAAQNESPNLAGYAGKRSALIEHLAALNRDAERYRWLRDLPEDSPHEYIGNMPGDRWDQLIDAAMSDEGC